MSSSKIISDKSHDASSCSKSSQDLNIIGWHFQNPVQKAFISSGNAYMLPFLHPPRSAVTLCRIPGCPMGITPTKENKC